MPWHPYARLTIVPGHASLACYYIYHVQLNYNNEETLLEDKV